MAQIESFFHHKGVNVSQSNFAQITSIFPTIKLILEMHFLNQQFLAYHINQLLLCGYLPRRRYLLVCMCELQTPGRFEHSHAEMNSRKDKAIPPDCRGGL